MPRLRGFPSRIRTSAKRRIAWGPGPSTTGIGGLQSVSASGKTLWGVSAAAVTDGQTIVRTRGELLLFLSTADGVTSGFHGAFGIAKVTAQAVAIGVTAVPGPVTDDDWDGWLYHRFFALSAADVATSTLANSGPLQMAAAAASLRMEIDSKAMRKISENESVIGVLEATEIGVSTLRMFGNTRLLVKLQ